MADLDLRGRTLGEFVLRELLGTGGFGDVYRAFQPRLDREVVVKVLRESDDGARQRFRRESQLASLLDHHFAAHIYASGSEDADGLLWIAMELVPGVAFDAWLREHGPMPLKDLVPFFELIADVVDCAHERGIIHRDLKPSNVMVIERGGKMIPKLVDFGIAKASYELAPLRMALWTRVGSLDLAPARADGPITRDAPAKDRLTRPGDKLGSEAYMSPEQWTNPGEVGPASDIYALGVLAYKALTGGTPFVAESQEDYQQHHLHTKVPPLGADFSPELDRVIQRALAKAPNARHGSAQELASELRTALRASEHEAIRSAAQQWEDKGRAPGLLWSGRPLAEAERLTRRAPGALGTLECSFVAASVRRRRRIAWLARLSGVLAAVIVLGALQYRAAVRTELAEEQTRSAQRVVEATITQAELEQGRSALLHGEPEAQMHLAEAYKRGDRSPSTAFMLARSLQPRLTEQARFASSFGRMWSATFSPDGRQIVTTDDRSAQIWDAQTYRRLFVLDHGGEVYQALYSADGTRLVTISQGSVRIWDVASGVRVHELAQKRSDGKPADYFTGALSPDGRLVSAIDSDGSRAHVWNMITGAPLAELRNDALGFPAIAFSANGRWLATSGGDDVRVFDVVTWRPVLTIRGPRIHSLAFDPTSPRLVTGAATGDVALWTIPSGARTRHLRDVGKPVDAVAFSPDGQLIVAASRDGAEQIWHADSGELRNEFNHRRSRILAVEFDRTSKLLLAAGADGTVAVADAALGMPITVLEGPQNVIRTAHFDPSSGRVVGASWDGTARVWDATSPYRRWSSTPVSDDCGITTTPSPDGRFIAVGCRGRTTRVWDTSRDQLLAELPGMPNVSGDFTSAFPAVSNAGDRAAIARDNMVEVYELPGGRLLRTIAHRSPVNAIAFASTGRDIVSGTIDGSLLVTRENGALLVLPSVSGGIDAVAFLPDGRVVASDALRRLRVYDRGGALLADLEIPVRAMSLRTNGARLVTIPLYTSNSAPPVLVDLERYRVVAQLGGHVGRVYSARWVAQNRIITAGGDGTVRMWDGSTGQLHQTYRGSSRLLADAVLSSDGLMVLAGGGDGLLRFWDAANGRLVWTLRAHESHLIGIQVGGDDIVTRGFAGELSRWRLPSSHQVIEACGNRERCVIVPK